jgi:TetR/AcrR family transcriptional regulator of autoinduction and epiphytic fitness
MPPTRQSPLKRAAILAAALDEFEARGYRETSMDRIAARAGVSKRTVYNHFLSKEQLFDAIAAQLIERVQEVSQRPYDPSQPLEVQLEVIGDQVLDMLASPSFLTLARVTLAELIRSPELARRTYGLFRARQTGLARWLADADADGRLKVAEPDRAADQFMGLINAFALWPQLLGGQPVPDAAERARILQPAVAMLLRQYRQRV